MHNISLLYIFMDFTLSASIYSGKTSKISTYINTKMSCLSVCLSAHVFLGHFEPDWKPFGTNLRLMPGSVLKQ